MKFTDKESFELSRCLYRALLDLGNNQPISDTKIRALSMDLEAAQKNLGPEPRPDNDRTRSLFFPLAALRGAMVERSLTPGTFNLGGSFVAEDVGSPEHMLRAASVMGKCGMRVIPNVHANVTIPRQVTDFSFTWLHELESITPTDPTFGGVSFEPKRLGGGTTISSTLDFQTGGIISTFLAESLTRGVAAGIDRGCIQGSGVAGEITGLLNLSGANGVTFGAAATWAKALSFVSACSGTGNATDENISWISHPSVRETWMQKQIWTGGRAIWETDETIAGKPAYVTTGCPNTSILAGDLTTTVLGLFGEGTPLKLIVDPFSQSLQGQVRFVAQVWADFGCLFPSTITKNLDSAVQ